VTLSVSAAEAAPDLAASASAPVIPSSGPRRGIGITDATLDPIGVWGRRQNVNARATLQHCLQWMERLGWLENFDRVARGETITDRPGWQFSDSEVYKLLEAMAWELARSADPGLQTAFDALVERVGAAQDADGYLNTAFGHPGLPSRYSDLAMGHELYNVGHLLQAAVAQQRSGGDDRLVQIARRAADQLYEEFGPAGRIAVCGHPEIEVALVEAGRAFGERRYLELAGLFVERRGHGLLPEIPLLSAEYFQDDTPIRDATVLRGHAVRALYLTAGALDVAVETDDRMLFDAVVRQWENTVARRTYVTGGMGSRHQDEGFGDDWELPADRAYCETCAGVGSIMLAWRLYLATGEVRYADLIERTMFNVVATSPSGDGRSFFYANPLHQRERGAEAFDGVNNRAEGGVRAPWFDVSCCPTNVARTLASLGAYLAAADEEGIAVLQYAAGELRLGGFSLRTETAYPEEGTISILVQSAPERESRLRLRIPDWAEGATVMVDGAEPQPVEPGWADIRRTFAAGDRIVIELPVEPRFTWPDLRIDAVRGSAAIERGPLVLCLESTDLPAGVGIDAVRLDVRALPVSEADGARVTAEIVALPGTESDLPYASSAPASVGSGPIELSLVPYHRWAERGPSTMRVFLPLGGTA